MNKLPPTDLVPMGKLLKPLGLKGDLRVKIFNEIDSGLKVGLGVWITISPGRYSDPKIESLKINGNKSSIRFECCKSRETAENLSGLIFSISRNEFVPLNSDEKYLVDAVNCQVFDEFNKYIGSVVDTLSLQSSNLIVVKTFDAEILIPLVDEHVLFFDNCKKVIIIKDIEGFVN